jgi:hypothetical protein
MKKLGLLVLTVLFSSGVLMAQEKAVDSDYCILLNDKVYHYQKDGVTMLTEDLTLKNGTIVQPDGKLKLKNGKSAKLEDGECIGMSGKRYKDQLTLNKKLLGKK